jgi:recombinational DNA repair protein (RecF pathway)
MTVGKKLDPKVAEAVMLKAKLKPLEPYTNSNTKWKCKCLKCGKLVDPIFSSIKRGRGGCIYCAKRKVHPKDAIADMLEAGFEPLEPYAGNKKRWKCKCLKCGKTVFITRNNVTSGHGCGYCARKIIDPEDAVKIMLKAKLQPLEPYTNSHSNWKCKCLKCGKIVQPNFASIGQEQGGCGYCAENLIDPEDAVKIMLKAKLQPLEPFKDAKYKWKCKCLKCNKVVYPNYKGVKQGEGCANCAIGGINPIDPAYIYLITHFELNSHKIGIANVRKIDHRDRLNQFKAKGWQAFQVWQVKTGLDALNIETKVFRVLRKDMNLPQYLSEKEMPITGGWSETVGADSISLVELEKIINKAIQEQG